MSVQYNTIINAQESAKVTKTASLTKVQNCLPKDPNYGKSHTYVGPPATSFAPVPENSVLSYTPVNETISRSPIESKQSFNKIRRSGAIKMTPYSHRSTKTTNLLVPVHCRERSSSRSLVFGGWQMPGAGYCDPGYAEERNLVSSFWTEQYDISRLANTPLFVAEVNDDFSKDINSLMSRVVSDSYKTHDLLTDLAEARSSLKLISDLLRAVRRPLQSYKKARDILKSRKATHDEIGSLWMQYRYAVMPIIYGISDAIDNFENSRYVFKTSRGSSTIDLSKDSPRGNPESTYLYQKVEGEAVIRATGKARFATSSLRLIDQTSFNVFNTAWELLPYSLVVDWFANVGDWIFIHSSRLADFSSQRSFCYSIKRTQRVTTYLHHYTPPTSGDMGRYPAVTQRGVTCPQWTITPLSGYVTEAPIQVVMYEWYDRYIYNPSDVNLSTNVQFSNWKRWIDAYILSLGPTLKLLKKLR